MWQLGCCDQDVSWSGRSVAKAAASRWQNLTFKPPGRAMDALVFNLTTRMTIFVLTYPEAV